MANTLNFFFEKMNLLRRNRNSKQFLEKLNMLNQVLSRLICFHARMNKKLLVRHGTFTL